MTLTRILVLEAQKLLLRGKRAWDRLATRTHLRQLPPATALLLVLAAGVCVPLASRVDARPAQLSQALAAERLLRFADGTGATLAPAGPTGEIYARRPTFFWPPQPDAAHYSFVLFDAAGNALVADDDVADTFFLLRPPGALEPGRYRFVVAGVDAEGRRHPHVDRSFRVQTPPDDLRQLHALVQMELDGPDGAFVMAGYYAERGSADDVISALADWKAQQNRVADLRAGAPSTWLDAEADLLRRTQ